MNAPDGTGGRLAGRRAIVTGAAGGIGAALAQGIAREGARVACVDMNEIGASEVAASIGEAGGRAISCVADVTNLEQVERMHATVFDAFGGVDLLVANAGGSQGEMIPFLELEPHVWQRMIDRNLTSVYYCSLVCARQMASNGGGAIVVTSSQLSEVARPGMGHYATAKGGVRQLVKAMAVDLAPHGIRVNAIAPGPTLTPGNPRCSNAPMSPRQTGARSRWAGWRILKRWSVPSSTWLRRRLRSRPARPSSSTVATRFSEVLPGYALSVVSSHSARGRMGLPVMPTKRSGSIMNQKP